MRKVIFSLFCTALLFAEGENIQASYEVAGDTSMGNVPNINVNSDIELKNAVDTINILGKATRDAEITENPNVISKTPEEIEEERQMKELNSYNKSLKAIKNYLDDTRSNLILKKTINNVSVAKIKAEKFYVEKQIFDMAIQEIETNVKEYSKITAQIGLIDKTIESNNYAVTQSVFNSFSTLISQISTSVDLTGNNNLNMGLNTNVVNGQEAKQYYEFINGDRVGNNIFIKKINNNSLEIYYKV